MERPRNSPISEVVVQMDSMANWQVAFWGELQAETGLTLTRQPVVSVSKNLYTDPQKVRAFLVVTDPNSSVYLQQVKSQIDFYGKYSANPAFAAVVVPMTAKLILQHGRQRIPVGMIQDYYGDDIRDFRRSGGRVTAHDIAVFTENYRRLIAQTRYPHGDLVVRGGTSPIVLWDHIRIGRAGLKFIDYHGQDGKIITDGNRYSPRWLAPGSREHQAFVQIRDRDPEILRVALVNFFGLQK